jgi:hypothetical protein
MKTLKTILIAIVIALTTSLANAKTLPDQSKCTLQFSITAYLNMVTNGTYKDYASILADNVKFNSTRNGKLVSHGKQEELDFIRRIGFVKQNCKTEYETLSSDDNFCVVKVRMIYENFTKENIISLAKTDKGWMITDVTSMFF